MENTKAEIQQEEGKEGTRTLRNFRSAPDIEHFYRFLHENDLRREAKMILDRVVKALAPKKRRKKKV